MLKLRLFSLDDVRSASLRAVLLCACLQTLRWKPTAATHVVAVRTRLACPLLPALALDQQDTVRCAEVARWFVTRRPEALLGYSMFFAALASGHAAVEEVIGTPHTKFFTRIASGIGSRLQTAPPWAANWVAAQQLVHNRSYGVMMGAPSGSVRSGSGRANGG